MNAMHDGSVARWLARGALLLALALISAGSPARAACPPAEQIAAAAEAWLSLKPTPGYGPGLSVEDAYCAQDRYVALIGKNLGPRAGYKVAFAGKLAQERFGIKEPARGVLFRSMLLKSGITMDPKFGVGPVFEPDLVVTVKDAGINSVKTPLEATHHLDEVVAFMELADLILGEGATVNGPNIIALNAGARYGVVGTAVKVQPTQAFVDAMASMEAVLTDDTGQERVRTKGESLMGNPLNALVWLIDNMRKAGLRMEPGDHISLGAMGAIMKPEPGRSFTMRYLGLPGGTPEARVTFR